MKFGGNDPQLYGKPSEKHVTVFSPENASDPPWDDPTRQQSMPWTCRCPAYLGIMGPDLGPDFALKFDKKKADLHDDPDDEKWVAGE